MARRSTSRLTETFIERTRKPGFYADGGNLYLKIAGPTSRRWVFRYELSGRMRDLSLGPIDNDARAPEKDAAGNPKPRTREERIAWTTQVVRSRAAHWRTQIREGKDPGELQRGERDAERAKVEAEQCAQAAAVAPVMTFRQACEALLDAKEGGWRNDKHRQQWGMTLRRYACRVTRDGDGTEVEEVERNPDGTTATAGLGPMPVADVTMADVLKVLRRDNLWIAKTETADRLRGRIHAVFAKAIADEQRTAANPADWSRLQHSLVAPGKLKKVRHHPSLAYKDLPGFLAQLAERDGVDAAALRFTTLTAVRTSEAIGANWSEIDFDACLWRIPGERMKTKKPHDVPLAPQTIAVLERMAAIRQNDFVFPGLIPGRPISNMAMLALLKRLGLKGVVTTHGMRATFKTWASEATDFDRLAVERCLAHEIGNAVEASYLRGELLGKRRVIMTTWADHCCGEISAASVPEAAAL